LVRRLGGRELYGDDTSVPLRELLQNATDAIRARRMLEARGENWGDVRIRAGRDSYGLWLEIEDNGVGMSTSVLTGAFIDFGTSCVWQLLLVHFGILFWPTLSN
jgi:nitrogen fixation/metabolism regulation signal transduction histidine kinase